MASATSLVYFSVAFQKFKDFLSNSSKIFKKAINSSIFSRFPKIKDFLSYSSKIFKKAINSIKKSAKSLSLFLLL